MNIEDEIEVLEVRKRAGFRAGVYRSAKDAFRRGIAPLTIQQIKEIFNKPIRADDL